MEPLLPVTRREVLANPLRILYVLDKHLSVPSELTLFGRAALALGNSPSHNHFHNTQDVDGILPLAWLEPPDLHEDFWLALQRTNAEVEPDGLYVTHLFRETDVILQPDWGIGGWQRVRFRPCPPTQGHNEVFFPDNRCVDATG